MTDGIEVYEAHVAYVDMYDDDGVKHEGQTKCFCELNEAHHISEHPDYNGNPYETAVGESARSPHQRGS